MKIRKRRIVSWLTIAAFLLSFISPGLVANVAVQAVTPAGNPVENLNVEAGIPFICINSDYTISFNTSSEGALGVNDEITVIFPVGYDLWELHYPGQYFLEDFIDIYLDNELFSGYSLFLDYEYETEEIYTLIITLTEGSVPAGAEFRIEIKTIMNSEHGYYTGIVNPCVVGDYVYTVYTTVDLIPATFPLEIKDFADITTVGEVPVTGMIMDFSSLWEYREGPNYSTEEVNPVYNSGPLMWLKVDDKPEHSTLLSAFPIAQYNFDENGNNSWSDSGSGSGNSGIRKFLNGSSYTGTDTDEYAISLYDSFSPLLQSDILPNANGDKIYLPTRDDLGYNHEEEPWPWDFFADGFAEPRAVFPMGEMAMAGELVGNNELWDNNFKPAGGGVTTQEFFMDAPMIAEEYWTSSPDGEGNLWYVDGFGDFLSAGAESAGMGVRPAMDLDPETPVVNLEGPLFVIGYPGFLGEIYPYGEYVIGVDHDETIFIDISTILINEGSVVTAKLKKDGLVYSEVETGVTLEVGFFGFAGLELSLFDYPGGVPPGEYEIEIAIPDYGLLKTMPYLIREPEIAELIAEGYVPVSNATELAQIKNDTLQWFGDGTSWHGEYYGGLDKKYVQVSFIDLNAEPHNIGTGWEPIGDFESPFSGTYNGNGHIISGLFIDYNDYYMGLFGYTGATAHIKNLTLTNVNVNSYWAVGGLVGQNNGLVSECSSSGQIQGVNNFIGGLVGYNTGGITNSYFTGSVTGNNLIGGLVGNNEGTVADCHAEAGVSGVIDVGGLVGYNNGEITNSSASCLVDGVTMVGGLVGNNDEASISGSSASGQVSGENYVGGLLGYNVDGNVSDSYATGDVIGLYYVGGLIGFSNFWYSEYMQVTNSFATGNVAGESSVGGLLGFNEGTHIYDSYATGSVEGNSCIGGLIGEIYSADVNRSFATGNVDSIGPESLYAGGLVGYNCCGVISESFAVGSVNVDEYAGGLIGYNDEGVVSNSYAMGAVNANFDYAGGLVGINDYSGETINSYATGAVTSPGTNVSGLVGDNSDGFVSNSYYDTNKSGQSDYDGRGIPRTTEAMQTSASSEANDDLAHPFTYRAWDNAIWDFTSATSYPRLQWYITEYPLTVTYNSNGATGGKVPYSNLSYQEGQTVTVLGNTGNLTRSGYTFNGWNTMSDGWGDFYDPADPESNTLVMGAEEVILYAQWEPEIYNITYLLDGGINNTLNPDTYTVEELPITLAEPLKEGYDFTGWSPRDNIAIGSMGDLTFTASWSIISYTVTFQDWDESFISSEEVEHGSDATAPADPIREGYIFTGWDTDFSNVTTNLVVTAQYNINTYTVTFQDWDESFIYSEEVEHGSSATAPADPIREGYIFIGWDTDFSNVNTNLTVTAVYELIQEELPREYPLTGFYVLSEADNYFIDIYSYIENIAEARFIVSGANPEGVMLVHQDGRATTLADNQFVDLTELVFSAFLENSYTKLQNGERFILSLNSMADAPVTETAGIETVYTICGDASGDGRLSIEDAIMVLRHVVGLNELTTIEIQRVVTEEGAEITLKDAITILRRIVGLEASVSRIL